MKINLVNACTWFFNLIDNQTLTSSEQLILLHLIKFLNRNFWKPTPLSISALCRSSGKDARTVKNALSRLISCGIITESENGYFLGYATDDIRHNLVKRARKSNTHSLSPKAKKTADDVERDESEQLNSPPTPDFKKRSPYFEGESFEDSQIVKELREGVLSENSKRLWSTLPREIQRKILDKIQSEPLFH